MLREVATVMTTIYTLEDLSFPIEHIKQSDVPTNENWHDLLEELENQWIDENIDDVYGDDYLSKAGYLASKFFNVHNTESLLTSEIETYFEPRKWQLTNLIRMRPRIPNYSETESEDKDALMRMLKRIYHGKDLLKLFVSFRNTFNPDSTENENDNFTKLAYWLEFDESCCKNSLQKVNLRIMKSFEGKNWRKCGQTLLKPVNIRVYLNDDDQEGELIETKAYEHAGLIREYVEDMCSADNDPELWLLANESAGTKKAVSENLELSKMSCLSDSRENHHLRSFGGDSRGRNAGIYNQKYDAFFLYGEEEMWPQQAQELQRERQKYDPEYVCIAPKRTDVCIHHFNVPFFSRKMGVSEGFINPTNCTNPDINFNGKHFFSIDPMTIQTPEMDMILETQGIVDHESKLWVYALMGGRNLYHVREHDRLESAFYLWGEGGTGKSTAISYVTGFYPFHRRGLMSNNMQTNFGTGDLVEADVIECPEVQEVMGLAEEEFKSMTSGESMSLNDKHKRPIRVKNWLSHMILAGNHIPKNFNDDGGQFLRRLFGICFFNRISDFDTRLDEKMEQKRSLYLRKFNLCYLYLMKKLDGKVPKKDSSLPPAFWKFTKTVKSQVNALVAFMQDADNLEFGPNYAMTLSSFKDTFLQYAKEYNIDRNKHPKWTQVHSYTNILTSNGCNYVSGGTSPENGIDVPSNIIIGCRINGI